MSTRITNKERRNDENTFATLVANNTEAMDRFASNLANLTEMMRTFIESSTIDTKETKKTKSSSSTKKSTRSTSKKSAPKKSVEKRQTYAEHLNATFGSKEKRSEFVELRNRVYEVFSEQAKACGKYIPNKYYTEVANATTNLLNNKFNKKLIIAEFNKAIKKYAK